MLPLVVLFMLKVTYVIIRQLAVVQQTHRGVAKKKKAIVFTILKIEHGLHDVAQFVFFGSY